MYIAIKDTKIIAIHELDWHCRMNAKGLHQEQYWTWLATVTTGDVSDYSGEDYTIEKIVQDLKEFEQSEHIFYGRDETSYHLKWDGTKVVKDDTAKAARELADEWVRIREQRTKRLAETDWVVIKARENGGTVPAKWKTYRVALRDLPSEQSAKTKYSDITWPTQPS